MLVRVMKYEVIKPIDIQWNEFRAILNDISYAVYHARRKTTNIVWATRDLTDKYSKLNDIALNMREMLGKSEKQTLYSMLCEDFPNVSSKILESAVYSAYDKLFNGEFARELWKGNAVVPRYSRNNPIPLAAQSIRLRKDNGEYTAVLSLLSKKSGKPTQYGVKLRSRGESMKILNRIISGEYSLGGSELAYEGRKLFLRLTYKYEPAAAPTERTAVVGVDLGVINAAVAAVNSGHDRLYIEGGEITAFNNRIDARRRSLQRQYKVAEGRKGHGRKTALKPTEVLAEKAANFRNMTNHKYAKAIVEFAVKVGAYRIQMEDLSGITENRDKFLKRWPYYDLQTKIANKAKEVGIEVVKVKPRYTSQRCSCCGYIADGNRPDQSTFKCVSCGYKTNADYNAARNIAEPRIEALIDEELRRQKMAMKHAN